MKRDAVDPDTNTVQDSKLDQKSVQDSEPDPVSAPDSKTDPASVSGSERELNNRDKKSDLAPYIAYIYYSLPLFSIDFPLPFPPGQLTGFTSPGVKVTN